LYIVESADEQLLRDIFYRVNNYGKRLTWDEVHDALFGQGSAHPSTLADLSTELFKLGIGKVDEKLLLQCLLAYKGLDVTRNVTVHYQKDPDVLKSAVEEALPTLRSTFSFLKVHAEIPHVRLLAHVTPVPVLTRFFALYPDPKPRSVELLIRWTWRTLLSASFYDDRTLLRHGINAFLNNDEEQSIQTLLRLVPQKQQSEFLIPRRFDARAADSRIVLLGMASLKPLSLENGEPVDIATLIDTQEEFRIIVRSKPGIARGPANRILLPGRGVARQVIIPFIKTFGIDSPVLHSHAISPALASALVNDQDNFFLEERQKELQRVVTPLISRLTGWGRSDRPSISYLLAQAGDEE
jgi:hypothetical protein